ALAMSRIVCGRVSGLATRAHPHSMTHQRIVGTTPVVATGCDRPRRNPVDHVIERCHPQQAFETYFLNLQGAYWPHCASSAFRFRKLSAPLPLTQSELVFEPLSSQATTMRICLSNPARFASA